LTTVLAIFAIPPVIYLFAQVLFPDSLLISSTLGSYSEVGSNGNGRRCSDRVGILWRVITALFSVDWFCIKVIFNFAWCLQNNLTNFLFSVEEYFSGEKNGDVKKALQKHAKVRMDGYITNRTRFISMFSKIILSPGIPGSLGWRHCPDHSMAACVRVYRP
jgi:hypothetical protein